MLDLRSLPAVPKINSYYFADHLAPEVKYHFQKSHMLQDVKVIRHTELLSGKYEKLSAKMPAKVRCYSCPDKAEDAHTDNVAAILALFTARIMDQVMENLYDTDYITGQIKNLTVYPETWVLPIPETLIYDLSYHMEKAEAFDCQVIPYGDMRLIPYQVMHFDKNPLPVNYRHGMHGETTKRIGLCLSRFSNYEMIHKILPLLQPALLNIGPEEHAC